VSNPGNLRGDPNQTPWEYKIIKLNYVKSNPKVYLVIAECKVYPALLYVINPSPLPTKNFTNHYHHRLVILVYIGITVSLKLYFSHLVNLFKLINDGWICPSLQAANRGKSVFEMDSKTCHKCFEEKINWKEFTRKPSYKTKVCKYFPTMMSFLRVIWKQQGSDINSNKTVFTHILNPSFPCLEKHLSYDAFLNYKWGNY